MRIKSLLFVLLIGALLISCSGTSTVDGAKAEPNPVGPFRIEVKSVGNDSYTIFHQGELQLTLHNQRPAQDSDIYLCVPAAFTRLDDGGIDGLYIKKGEITNRNQINYTLGGAFVRHADSTFIFDTPKGTLLTDELIERVSNDGGDLFQQIMIVVAGKAEKISSPAEFQRRALVRFNDGSWAVVENFERITLQRFADDLTSLGVESALYLDMGAWDEGWYRKDDKVETIGRMRSATDRQTNWIVFRT